MLMSMMLRAKIDIDARRAAPAPRIAADELHHARLGLAVVVHAPLRLARAPQALVGAEHFRRCKRRAELPAQLAKRPVGHAGHGEPAARSPRG